MGLAVYGGDPQVIATRDEIFRCSANLGNVIAELQSAIWAQAPPIFDFLPNPIPNLQLALSLPSLISQLEGMILKLELAAEGYFSTEAQINAQLNQVFAPLQVMTPIATLHTPFAPIVTRELLGISAALAVVGLSGAPSMGKSALVGSAVTLAPLAFGQRGPQEFLRHAQQGLIGLGLQVDSRGSANLIRTTSVLPANSLAEHAQRLGSAYVNPTSSIRIEVYRSQVGRSMVVYVPGTQSFDFSGKNPLNIRSNLTAMGNVATAPSQEAVEAALEQLGATKGDRVLFVGHSQGALISGNIAAADHDYEVSGLISLGGPISHIDLKVPVIALENSQDPVPHLSGDRNPLLENWVTAQSDVKYETLVEAHEMRGYTNTALQADLSSDLGLSRLKAALIPTESSPGEEYVFEISRG